MLISFIIQFSALWFLSQAQKKHFKLVFNIPFTTYIEKKFKGLGWILLLLSYGVALIFENIPMASVYWLSFLSLNILSVTIFNSFYAYKFKKV
ncbi:DUF3325 domain-containing protein [Pseudoalteromonas denitrificans]|jgi:hypothetical protein|uniref:Uncharacterized protein n=1 Tax=Pseudoalteromonas denitrificans DSM 6059 TaxID=1123010 RepID=A0A1I1IF57_9GAMM|nr:Protein of unknown function [Pseudoalteromonas denitrificans DSM 6059]